MGGLTKISPSMIDGKIATGASIAGGNVTLTFNDGTSISFAAQASSGGGGSSASPITGLSLNGTTLTLTHGDGTTTTLSLSSLAGSGGSGGAGPVGPTGPQGATGATGATGPQGPAGAATSSVGAVGTYLTVFGSNDENGNTVYYDAGGNAHYIPQALNIGGFGFSTTINTGTNFTLYQVSSYAGFVTTNNQGTGWWWLGSQVTGISGTWQCRGLIPGGGLLMQRVS